MNEFEKADSAASWDDLASQGVESLLQKLEAHRWWMEDYADWSLSQDDGVLSINSNAEEGTVTARAPAQIIGSFNRADDTWLWAWANESIDESLKQDAQRVREFGERKGFASLTDRKLFVEPNEPFALAAVASHICESNGVFSAGVGDALLYFSLGEVSLQKGGTASPGATNRSKPRSRLTVLLLVLAALFFLPIIGAVIGVMLERDDENSPTPNQNAPATQPVSATDASEFEMLAGKDTREEQA